MNKFYTQTLYSLMTKGHCLHCSVSYNCFQIPWEASKVQPVYKWNINEEAPYHYQQGLWTHLREHTHPSVLTPLPHTYESRVDFHNDPKAFLNHQRLNYVEPHFSEKYLLLFSYLNVGHPHITFLGPEWLSCMIPSSFSSPPSAHYLVIFVSLYPF